MLFGVLVVGGLLLGRLPALAQPADTASVTTSRPPSARADSSTHPNQQPYATERSVAYHVLASPAYLLHGVTRPLGWGVQYVEQTFPNLFTGERPPRGVLPRFELGGPTGFQAGLALYDNQFLGSNHKVRVAGLYGGPNTFETGASYVVPAPFGPGTRLDISGTYFSDPSRTFFPGGNASDDSSDKGLFERDQIDVQVGLDADLPGRALRGEVDLLYEHVEAGRGDGVAGDRLARANPPGLSTVDLLTTQLMLGLDRTRGRPGASAATRAWGRHAWTKERGRRAYNKQCRQGRIERQAVGRGYSHRRTLIRPIGSYRRADGSGARRPCRLPHPSPSPTSSSDGPSTVLSLP